MCLERKKQFLEFYLGDAWKLMSKIKYLKISFYFVAICIV